MVRENVLMGGRLEGIAHRCQSLFEDDEFDIGLGAPVLGTRFTTQLLRYPDEEVHWVRPNQFGDGKLYSNGHNDFDFSALVGSVDGASRDLVPVLQAMCTKRPDYLKSVFVSYNATVGCCVCRLFHDGKFELVVIDDRIPCRRIRRRGAELTKAQELGWPEFEPISAHSTTGEAWLPLLEKAMAKVNGSYSATALADGARDLFKDITGGEHVVDIQLKPDQPGDNERIFQALQPRFARNELLVVARKSTQSARTWAAPQRVSAVLNLDRGVDAEKMVDVFGDKVYHSVKGHNSDCSFNSLPADLQQQRGNSKQYVCVAADDDLIGDEDYDELDIKDDLHKKIEDAKEAHPVVRDGRHELFGMVHKTSARKREAAQPKQENQNESSGEAGTRNAESASPKVQWMSWAQFCEDYERLTVCIVSGDGHLCKDSPSIHADLLTSITGAWDSQMGTAGGGHHLKTWRNSPLFRLQMQHNVKCRGRLLLTVSLPDGRRTAESLGADTDDWDGDQDGGGRLIYPSHALYVCKDEPTLANIVVNTDYHQCRDSTVELSVDTATNGPFSYIAVPCTQDDNVDHEFFLTATLLDEHGSRVAMSIQRVTSFKGFNFSAKVQGRWVRGQSAMGHVAKFNEWSALNPCWMMRILGTDKAPEMSKNRHDNNDNNNTSMTESKLDTDRTGSVFKRPQPVTPSKDDGQVGVDGNNTSALDMGGFEDGLMSPDMPAGGHNSMILPSSVEPDDKEEELMDAQSKDGGSSKDSREGSVMGAASMASQLTYDNMNDPNMQGDISVASNDTGSYSATRLTKKDSKPTVRHFNICALLSPSVTREFGESASRPSSAQNSRSTSPSPYSETGDSLGREDATYLRSGTYFLTPNAFARLLHRKGDCGEMHVNDGYLGKFRMNAYPVTSRLEKFCVFSGGAHGGKFLHRGSDVYEHLFIMPALNEKGQEGSFSLEIMSNLPFELEPVDLSQVPFPLKDLKSLNAVKTAALLAATRKRAPLIDGFIPTITPTYGIGDAQTAFARTVVTKVIENTSLSEEEVEAAEASRREREAAGPTTLEVLGLEEKVEEEEDDPNSAIRSSFTIIRKKIATQIKEDTSKRVMAITTRQWATEDMLEREIARCEADNRAKEDALVNSVLSGGQHH